MVSMIELLKTFLRTEGLDKTYWVAFSGGMDSTVLLHLLVEMKKAIPFELRAVHIHHGLSSAADQWARQCAEQCQRWGIELIIQKVNARSQVGESPEALARDLRYGAIGTLLSQHDYLLTAHHQDDQAETVLLQLLRGAGPKGLAGMPRVKPLGAGFHGRPLLQVPRTDLNAYARERQLTWIEDESNQNQQLTRNFLRQTILPLFKNRWPTVTRTLGRVATVCAENQRLLDELMESHLLEVQGSVKNTLSIKKLLTYSKEQQRHLLRAWCEALQYPLPTALILQQIQSSFLTARPDKSPRLQWQAVELRRFRDDLYLFVTQPPMARPFLHWDFKQPLLLPDGQYLYAKPMLGQGISATIKNVTIQFRKGGERCQFSAKTPHRTLKNCFQEWGVPPWLRAHVPLVYVENELIAVVGYFLNQQFAAESQEKGYSLTLNV